MRKTRPRGWGRLVSSTVMRDDRIGDKNVLFHNDIPQRIPKGVALLEKLKGCSRGRGTRELVIDKISS